MHKLRQWILGEFFTFVFAQEVLWLFAVTKRENRSKKIINSDRAKTKIH